MNKFLRLVLPVVAVVMLLNIFAVTESNAQGILSEILKRMDTYNKGLSSLRADVTMSKVNVQLGETDVVSGKVIYVPRKGKDALIRIDWTKPTSETLAVIDKTYYIYKPSVPSMLTGSTNSAKGNSKAGGALAFMSMSRAQMRENYTVAYLGEGTLSNGTKAVHLQMTPKVKTSYKTAEIWVDANGMPMQSKIIENNGDTTTVLLSNPKTNDTVNASEFKIDTPKGLKPIKG